MSRAIFDAPMTFPSVDFFVQSICWNKERDRLADNLIRCIAEDALGPPIPSGDDAINVFGHNRISRGLDDRAASLELIVSACLRSVMS
jgi:hypothetical protein